MGLLKDSDKEPLRKSFKELQDGVKLIVFTQENECQYCSITREMIEEVAELSDKITAEIRDFVKDADLAKQYRIDKIPAIAVLGDGDKDYGIRFFGVPAGYEFTTLIEDIADVSRRDPGLPEEVLRELEKVDQPVTMQAMISPT